MLIEVMRRIEELTRAIEQSAANYNSLVGSLQEAKRFYEVLAAKEQQLEDSPPVEPAIDAEFVESPAQDVAQ